MLASLPYTQACNYIVNDEKHFRASIILAYPPGICVSFVSQDFLMQRTKKARVLRRTFLMALFRFRANLFQHFIIESEHPGQYKCNRHRRYIAQNVKWKLAVQV